MSPQVATVLLSLLCSVQGIRVTEPNKVEPAKTVTVAVQYFKHPDNIKALLEGFAKSPVVKEVFIADDSHDVDWSEYDKGQYPFVFRHFERDNQHEIRNYNFMTKQATGDFMLFWQDDNIPRGGNWFSRLFYQSPADLSYIEDAVHAFNHYPELGLLALDPAMKKHPPRFTGQELLERGTIGCHWTCEHGIPEVDVPADMTADQFLKDPVSGRPLAFTWGTSLFAFMARRSSFMEFGMFDEKYSEPGQPGIGFEESAAIKTWANGKMFAVMDIRDAQDRGSIGVGGHASKDKSNPNSLIRMRNEKINIATCVADYGTRMAKIGESIIAANSCLVHQGSTSSALATCLSEVPKVPKA